MREHIHDEDFFHYYVSRMIPIFSWASAFIKRVDRSLLCFDDLLIDDISAMTSYIHRRMLTFMYKFLLLYITLYHGLFMPNVTILANIVYCVMFLAIIAKITWFLPNYSLASIKLWGCVDLLVLFAINHGVNSSNPREYSMTNFCLITAFCFFCSSLLTNISLALIAALSNSAHFHMGGSTREVIHTMVAYTTTYALPICIFQAYHILFKECSRRFTQIRAQAEEQIKNKTMFVASVSHDLKNPLNSLLGFIDLLKASPNLSRTDKSNLITASYSGQILRYLIGNILDGSKLEIGKFDVDRIPMNISSELRKIMKIERALTRGKNIRLYKKQLTPIPPQVFGDRMRFTQALINLVGNSIKFTTYGYVAVVIRWVQNADEVNNIHYEGGNFIPSESYFNSFSTRGQMDDVNENLTESVQEKVLKHKLRCKGGRKASSCRLYKSPKEDFSSASYFKPQATPRMPHRVPVGSTLVAEEADSEDEMEEELQGEFSDSGILVLDVIDTGIGMTEDEVASIFKPFTQANATVKGRFGGTGLGLWITKQLVNRMSGVIEVRSQYRKGTRFRLTLPFKVINRGEGCCSHSIHSVEEDCKIVTATNTTLTVSGTRAFPASASVLGGSSLMSRFICRAATDLRNAGKVKFTGSKETLKGMKVLLIENDKGTDDFLLEQILNQVKGTDCDIAYSTYSEATKKLHENNYNFDGIIVISMTPSILTKKVVTEILKSLKDANAKPVPLAITSGLGTQREYEEIARDLQITVPLKEGEIISMLLKMKSKGQLRKKRTIGGKYGELVENLFRKYHMNGADAFNPCKVAKVLLADDDALSNLALRTMIEQTGKYQVFPFYNGVEASEFFEERVDEISAVVLDVEMPERNGIETARWIREFERTRGRNPVAIIGLTGHEGDYVNTECINAGMNMVLSKPIKKWEVIETLKRFTEV